MTDFTIHKWSDWYLINAHTEKGEAWMQGHWRSRTDPPRCRATKVIRLLSEILYWWTTYEPGYTVKVDADVAADMRPGERIIGLLENDDER